METTSRTPLPEATRPMDEQRIRRRSFLLGAGAAAAATAGAAIYSITHPTPAAASGGCVHRSRPAL